MVNPSKRKGSGYEREIVRDAQEAGIMAERVPLSGAVKGGSFEQDVQMPVRGIDRKFECKRRCSGFKQHYRWIEGAYGVIYRDNHEPSLVVLRYEDFLELAK
jgi:hypothetical protein